ncbi:MAG: hypothetical protein KDE15_02020 [Erythrobacter sp.]|nr:hypothetical protein [Erythrobacter sp.]
MPDKLPSSGELDLFGLPVITRRGRGRPPHQPTAELRAKAAAMHQAGAAQPEIAAALGLTIPTLVRHYWRELESRSESWRNLKGANNA